MALVQPPVVPAMPANDSSARIVQALNRQIETRASAEQVTLADLTLVATASARHQVAASPAAGSGVRSGRRGGGSGGRLSHPGANQQKMTPEQEQREVDEMARRVLVEIDNLRASFSDRLGHYQER